MCCDPVATLRLVSLRSGDALEHAAVLLYRSDRADVVRVARHEHASASRVSGQQPTSDRRRIAVALATPAGIPEQRRSQYARLHARERHWSEWRIATRPTRSFLQTNAKRKVDGDVVGRDVFHAPALRAAPRDSGGMAFPPCSDEGSSAPSGDVARCARRNSASRFPREVAGRVSTGDIFLDARANFSTAISVQGCY